MTVEHRFAPGIDSINLTLQTRDHVHLKVRSDNCKKPNAPGLADRIITCLKSQSQPMQRIAIRDQLKINNQRFGQELTALIATGRISVTSQGISLSRRTQLPGETESGSAGTQPDKG